MNDCNLWISKLERRPGKTPQYIYSYPAKRWRKKKRPTPVERASEVKAAETGGRSLWCCQGRGRDSQLSLSLLKGHLKGWRFDFVIKRCPSYRDSTKMS